MFTILINGHAVLDGHLNKMRFKSYAAAEMYARYHFAGSEDVFSIVIQTESKLS